MTHDQLKIIYWCLTKYPDEYVWTFDDRKNTVCALSKAHNAFYSLSDKAIFHGPTLDKWVYLGGR